MVIGCCESSEDAILQGRADRMRKIRIHRIILVILWSERKTSMSHPILVTGAAGGKQGSTGRLITSLLLQQGIPVRALVRKLDSRSDELRQQGAEVVEGDLLNPASVQAALQNVK